jgi:hypothetical protein
MARAGVAVAATKIAPSREQATCGLFIARTLCIN